MPDAQISTVTWILFRDRLPDRMTSFPNMSDMLLLTNGARVWSERIYFKGRNYDTGGAVAWAAMPSPPKVSGHPPRR